MSAPAKIPPAPLLPEQARRREQNRIRARQRQLLYPRDPSDPTKRITRESPRTLFPSLEAPATRSVRVVCEHPTAHPNEFLYLLQYTDAPVPTYAFHTPSGERWRTTFPSIYAACVAAAQAGYLDASW